VTAANWEFPWLNPDEKIDKESATVTKQGAWVLLGEMANSGLGFGFWALAARLFSTDNVGTAATLVSLSSLATSIAILGLDNGLVRFVSKVREPRRMIRHLVTITGLLGALVGVVFTYVILTLTGVGAGQVPFLVGISAILTVSQIWFQVTDGVILAAGRSQILAYRALAYGIVKIGLVLVMVSAGAAGLFAAYTVPLLLIVIASFLLVPRLWPKENPAGTPYRFRAVANLSAGNWVSGFAYSLPNRLAPSLIVLFLGKSGLSTVAFFFIALQLAEVLNYVSESVAKSLFAHGSLQDRLTHNVTASVRGLLAIVLIPLIAVGLVAAPFAMSVVGGQAYSDHYLALQLFLLAVLPKSYYQVLKAKFNVDRRPKALIVSGSALGVSTLVFLVIGLALRVDPDLLPISWILGGIAGLLVSQYMAGWRPRFPSRNAGVT